MASKGLIYVLGDNTIRVCGDAQVFSRLCLAFVHVCMSCWYCVRVGSRRVGGLNIFSLSAIVHYVISCLELMVGSQNIALPRRAVQ